MAYDHDLANRIRELLSGEAGTTEKAMFGGLAFLLHGNMAIAASGRGGVMVRIDPDDADDMLGHPYTEVVVMRGRQMPGWIRVGAEGVKTKRQLQPWVRRALKYTRTLPPKG